jgi:hypothetical protein
MHPEVIDDVTDPFMDGGVTLSDDEDEEIVWEEHTTVSGHRYWWNNITEESRWTNPSEEIVEKKPDIEPHPPSPVKPHPPSPVVENKPHPPPPVVENKPHPPPPVVENKPHPPPPVVENKPLLLRKIIEIQKKYIDSHDIDNHLVQIIIEHMRIIEPTDIKGEQKKTIVLNSIKAMLSNNTKSKKEMMLHISSQLIDTFIAFDKHKLNITNEKISSLSCLGW